MAEFGQVQICVRSFCGRVAQFGQVEICVGSFCWKGDSGWSGGDLCRIFLWKGCSVWAGGDLRRVKGLPRLSPEIPQMFLEIPSGFHKNYERIS